MISEDETLGRCDRIAEKTVRFFAAQDNAGPVRQSFLSKCVLGPDKTYTAHGQEWVDCMDEAVSAAELSNCEKVFEYRLQQDKLAEVREAIETGIRAYLCDQAGEDVIKEHEDKIENLRVEAKALGADEGEIPTVAEVMAGVQKSKFCKE